MAKINGKIYKAMRITSGFGEDGMYFQNEHYYNETYLLLEAMAIAKPHDRFYKLEQLMDINEAKEFGLVNLENPDHTAELGANFLDKFKGK
jgi:hypothetical protein